MCAPVKCECNGNATVVLPVSNEELPLPLLIFRLLQPDDPTSASPADLDLGNLANLAPIHFVFRSRNLGANKHAKTSCGYAAAPLRRGF